MRKLFGKKKKGSEDSSSPSGSASLQPSQGGLNGAPGEVLSVKPAYLNLTEFTFPARALSMFSNSRDEEIILDRCRRCSDGFTHTFMNWTTNIIAGIPKTDDYRAISYVWGQTIQLPMRCSHCGHSFHIPMHSAYRFRRLMMMTANSGDSVWLDALSIDQTSPEDKARIIAVMGDIYSRAKTVAVLFPEADGEGFKIMYDLTQAATAINANKLEFSQPGQDGHPSPRLAELSKVCTEFYEMLGQFDQNLHKYLYWRRAWTFQEWALARNISITWEGGMPLNLEPVKTVILQAATTTSIYAFSQREYAIIKMGFSGASIPSRFEIVRRLFPDELAFHPLGTVDEKEISIDVMMPSMRFGSALGLRASRGPDMSRLANPLPIDQMFSLRPNLQESEEDQFQNRLSMALSTFGISKREARFEADLISCWASMCNIKYAYDVHDSYVVALQKVLHSLRTEHKLKVYNFLVNTSGASGEVDAHFQDYACLHEQCNAAIVKGKFSGIPIFTGRADTGIHLRLAIARPTILPQLRGSGVELRKIKDASILFVVPLKNHDEVLFHMARAVSGTVDGMVFTDVLQNISDILKHTPPEQLERSSLAIVRIPLNSPDANAMGKVMGMVTWAIIPSDLAASSCFVAREGLNGTLVLAAPGKDRLEVVAYITLTDHQSGTLLISVDAHESSCGCGADHGKGSVELTLKSPIRGGVVNSALVDDRLIRGSIRFEDGSYIAY
ncbi:heterokaryon incompatibility protein-domain-containing protein [Halenospora varia]|nr:heterokaryon incompatibility protein-domain-containing protein [Halenospora varia]